MVDNKWAEPEGYKESPPRVAYRILDSTTGQVVTRHTESAIDFHRQTHHLSLSGQDQRFADEYTALLQRACAYFYQQDGYMPMEGWEPSRATDDEVRARIHRITFGENTREAERTTFTWKTMRFYPLDELPWALQRALIEQIDRLKAEWQFEIIGEVEAVAPAAPPPLDPEMLDPYARWGEW